MTLALIVILLRIFTINVSFGGESNHSTFDMAILTKRPVRIRMQGVVGAGGEKLPAT